MEAEFDKFNSMMSAIREDLMQVLKQHPETAENAALAMGALLGLAYQIGMSHGGIEHTRMIFNLTLNEAKVRRSR